MAYLDRVNLEVVSPDLLAEAMVRHADMEPEDRASYEGRVICIIKLLDERGITDRGMLLNAIVFRLEAMARLAGDDALRAWTLPGGVDGMDYVHAELVQCAAEEPLVERDNGAAFDAESFRTRLLALGKAGGRA